ncbi:cyclic nucleotide-binding domain-containing protein [Flavobacterium sp. Sd200]|uniref:Crp/Fnr family transcriptional regulator n=1 Tax=Flavobacterium sp. Sd200 TaxID=2692211 RepID=UPI00136F160E|nr:Crp/Fnr family transcriptional regulator [Flavobacterium sp. Sd200]MXN92419.1 cyclic nucleotide-binding domain-containing protein [Flavobacterium sp. Sd200]
MDVQSILLNRIEQHGNLWQEEKIHLKRNQTLIKAGSICSNIYFVTDGALRIFYQTPQGDNTIRFAYKGSLFTQLDSLLTEKPSVYSVEALRKTTLIEMPKEAFTAFIDSDIQNLQLWNALLSYTIVQLLERETDLLATTPKERYERVFMRSPQLFQHIPHKHIAAYLRMAPETLSRLKKS